jgi:hypothetical protein
MASGGGFRQNLEIPILSKIDEKIEKNDEISCFGKHQKTRLTNGLKGPPFFREGEGY